MEIWVWKRECVRDGPGNCRERVSGRLIGASWLALQSIKESRGGGWWRLGASEDEERRGEEKRGEEGLKKEKKKRFTATAPGPHGATARAPCRGCPPAHPQHAHTPRRRTRACPPEWSLCSSGWFSTPKLINVLHYSAQLWPSDWAMESRAGTTSQGTPSSPTD